MPRTVVRALVGALVVTVTALTGCTAQPGAAAVVDGRVITSAELAGTIDDLGVLTGGAAPADVLQALIIAPDVVQAAADNGVGVSEDEGIQLLNDVAANNGLEAREEWSDGSILIAELQLADNAIYTLPDAQEIAAQINETISAREVEVNPRFGTFDPETRAVVALDRPWIAAE